MKPTLSQYLRKLIGHATNAFSVLTLLLAVITLFLPADMVTKAIPISVLVALSLMSAGFYTWKEAIEKIPLGARLSIVHKSIGFGANSLTGGIPHSPMHFHIDLDLINHGQEMATLNELKVATFEMNTELLASSPKSYRLYEVNSPHASRDISFPYCIEGGQRKPNIRYEIEVDLREREPHQFAHQLGKLQDYRIDLQYTYEDMERTTHVELISIQGSFSKYRENTIQEWKQGKQFDLVTEALGV